MSIGLVVDAADTAVRPVKRKQRRIRRARLDKRTTLVRRALELRQLFASELMKVGADVETARCPATRSCRCDVPAARWRWAR